MLNDNGIEDRAENGVGSQEVAKSSTSANSQRIIRDRTTGRFQPGNRSGGRPLGALNHATRARDLLAYHAEELVQIALEKVRTEGSTALLSDLLRFSMPQQRSQLASVSLPEAAAAMESGDFDGALGAVTQAVLLGDISADAGKVATEQIRGAEEAKRMKRLEEEISRLGERVINGMAKRVA